MKETALKDAICDCCGQRMEFHYAASPLDYCLDKQFNIYRCISCGHGSTAGVEDRDLDSVYEGGAYDKKEKIWHRLLRPLLNSRETRKVAYLKRNQGHGNLLLEIGTGKGYFLQSALKAGYDAYGIEPSTRSFNIARKILGDRVHQCTLEEMSMHQTLNRKYDFIFLWHVLEHLRDPRKAIQLLRSFLKPDGVIIIGVPNFNSYQSRFGKSNWYHLDPPRHLSHFTPHSISALTDRMQMSMRGIVYDSFFQNLMGEIITLNNKLLPHKNILLNVLRFNDFYFSKVSKVAAAINLFAFLTISTVVFIPAAFFTLASQWSKRAGTMVILLSNKDN
jgi:SAM-dependent methyltransferase